MTLKTGLFGSQESFVPLADASFEGDDIRVPVTKKAVHDAPRVDADGHLSVEEEDDLYRYYGLHNPGGHDGDATADRRDDDVRDDSLRNDQRDDDRDTESHGGHAAAVGAGAAGAAAAVTGRDRDDDLAQRDVEGRDQVADRPDGVAAGSHDDDRSVHAEDGPEQATTSAAASGDRDTKDDEG